MPCSGIEACEVALLKAKRGVLDGNFIEGMACDGGLCPGAGCLVRSPATGWMWRATLSRPAAAASPTRWPAGSWSPRTAWGEGRPCAQASAQAAEAAAKTESTARKA
ncbi:MAG: hypothetical protein ACLUJG_08030 [Lawsonibacter sp.]